MGLHCDYLVVAVSPQGIVTGTRPPDIVLFELTGLKLPVRYQYKLRIHSVGTTAVKCSSIPGDLIPLQINKPVFSGEKYLQGSKQIGMPLRMIYSGNHI